MLKSYKAEKSEIGVKSAKLLLTKGFYKLIKDLAQLLLKKYQTLKITTKVCNNSSLHV